MAKSILQIILAFLARRMIRRYDPIIIGITGSVGKTSTREAVYAVLAKKFFVHTAEKNYNNEIGMPLTILLMRHHGKNILRWGFSLLTAFSKSFFIKDRYPEVLVLEYGVDRPRDMDFLISIARPHIAIVTKIGAVPVHVEFFKDPDALAGEKEKLVASLPSDGYALLNQDDPAVRAMRVRTAARVLTFGKSLEADFRIMNSELRMKNDEEFGRVPAGLSFKIQYKGAVTQVFLPSALGAPQLYAAGAAALVGILMRMDIDEIVSALAEYAPPQGRLRILSGIKHTLIIDDTYNAAPESMREALLLLESLFAKRKIAVLGDMLELGRYSEEAHREIGRMVGSYVDILLTVGPQARLIGEEMKLLRKAKSRGGVEKVFSFANAISAGKMLESLLRPGDAVLIKGSQGIRMEKIVEEIMANREHAKKLLVRQEDYWKKA